MAQLTITDAARVTGVSRVTLHRYSKAGQLSRSADGTINTAAHVSACLANRWRIASGPRPCGYNHAVKQGSKVCGPCTAALSTMARV